MKTINNIDDTNDIVLFQSKEIYLIYFYESLLISQNKLPGKNFVQKISEKNGQEKIIDICINNVEILS